MRRRTCGLLSNCLAVLGLVGILFVWQMEWKHQFQQHARITVAQRTATEEAMTTPAPAPTFFDQMLKLNRSNNIQVNPQRGFWSGTDTALYHRARFGRLSASRLVRFFISEGTRSVVDLGGGDGGHARTLRSSGLLVSCYDGNPDTQLVSNGTCAVLDLTRPVHLAPHDWVLSLSVGRQIPPEYEQVFIQNVHASNSRGVVIYWGDDRPNTSGRKTIRSNAEVIRNFEPYGYRYDAGASEQVMGGRKAVEAHHGYSTVVLRRMQPQALAPAPQPTMVIRIAVVCCSASKLRETLTMTRAAILFTQHVAMLTVYAFSDEATKPELAHRLAALHNESTAAGLHHFEYTVHPTSFPAEIPDTMPWSQVFKPCSLQRLFLPDVLPDVDSVLYLDADTLPLTNLSMLWSYFEAMNSSQFVALAPITEPKLNSSWFTKHHIPHYGPTGLNCGVALMNLTRMRQHKVVEQIVALRVQTEDTRPPESGDQFLQNIFFSAHPEHVLLLPCDWNFRRLHCRCAGPQRQSACACQSAVSNGVSMLHGTKNAFSDPDREPLFRSISRVFESHALTQWSRSGGWEKAATQLVKAFMMAENTCFVDTAATFYKRFTEYMKNVTVVQTQLYTQILM